MSVPVFKKHPATRAAHYFFLLPFLPALRPLLVNYRTLDMMVYLTGMALVLFIIIYSNQRPLISLESNYLQIYLHYRHNVERHPYQGLLGYRRLSTSRVALHSTDHSPVILTMSSRDVTKLIEKLEEEGIYALSSDT